MSHLAATLLYDFHMRIVLPHPTSPLPKGKKPVEIDKIAHRDQRKTICTIPLVSAVTQSYHRGDIYLSLRRIEFLSAETRIIRQREQEKSLCRKKRLEPYIAENVYSAQQCDMQFHVKCRHYNADAEAVEHHWRHISRWLRKSSPPRHYRRVLTSRKAELDTIRQRCEK